MPVHNVWRKFVFWDDLRYELDTALGEHSAVYNAALANGLAGKADRALADNPQPGSWTLTETAPLFLTRMTSASANVVTVPNTSTVTVPALQPILIARWGAGITTITAAANVTLRPANNLRLATQYDWCTLMRITANEWLVKGEAVV